MYLFFETQIVIFVCLFINEHRIPRPQNAAMSNLSQHGHVDQCWHQISSVNATGWANAELMLAQRRWRWTNMSPALGQRLVFHRSPVIRLSTFGALLLFQVRTILHCKAKMQVTAHLKSKQLLPFGCIRPCLYVDVYIMWDHWGSKGRLW